MRNLQNPSFKNDRQKNLLKKFFRSTPSKKPSIVSKCQPHKTFKKQIHIKSSSNHLSIKIVLFCNTRDFKISFHIWIFFFYFSFSIHSTGVNFNNRSDFEIDNVLIAWSQVPQVFRFQYEFNYTIIMIGLIIENKFNKIVLYYRSCL